MQAELFVDRILDDEGLTAGLTDPEARMLIEWLVEEVEHIADKADSEPEAWKQVEELCRRMRGIRRFVSLWCHTQDHGAAIQLAAAERFPWPLPPSVELDPCGIMERILAWEQSHRQSGRVMESWDR
jgi:hypothetical protein